MESLPFSLCALWESHSNDWIWWLFCGPWSSLSCLGFPATPSSPLRLFGSSFLAFLESVVLKFHHYPASSSAHPLNTGVPQGILQHTLKEKKNLHAFFATLHSFQGSDWLTARICISIINISDFHTCVFKCLLVSSSWILQAFPVSGFKVTQYLLHFLYTHFHICKMKSWLRLVVFNLWVMTHWWVWEII